MAVFLSLTLTLLWGSYLFFYRLVFAFEATPFYLLLGFSFLLVYAAVLTNVLRLLFFGGRYARCFSVWTDLPCAMLSPGSIARIEPCLE